MKEEVEKQIANQIEKKEWIYDICKSCEKAFQLSTGHNCKGGGKRRIQIIKRGLSSMIRDDEIKIHLS